jgi:type I restriction enzyme S subunit
MVEAKTKVQRYERYKESGIEWLGKIPEHWKIESFKNILTERNEKNAPIRTKEILSLSIDKGVTLYAEKTTNLDRFKDDFSKYKLAHKGDLVFNSMNMIVGAVGVSDYYGCVSPVYYTYYGEFNSSYTSKFYEYLFRSKIVQGVLFSLGKGLMAIDRGDGKYNTLRLKVSRDDLRSMKLPFPNASEQSQIVQFLDEKTTKIDEAITIKQQQISLLKERKQILIHKAVKQGLNPNVKLKDSGVEWIGEIPEHWEVKRLKYLGNTFAGITGKSGEDFTKEEKEGFKPFVPFTSIFSNEIIDTSKHQFVKIRENEGQNRVIKGDLLFLMSSETLEDIGKCSIYLGLENELYLNSFCKGFRFSNPIINAVFTNHLLQSFSYRHYFSLKGRGFTRINIKQEFVLAIPILIPPLSEQKEIASYIETASKKIETAINLKQQEIAKLKEYKSSLINGVVTGKVKVC